MRRFLYFIKTFFAAVTVAFASTVSAVHVHDIIAVDCSSTEIVHATDDAPECFLCVIVYQTHISDFSPTDLVSPGLHAVSHGDAVLPLKQFSFDWNGRAPPVTS